jgi:hypothetical protein
MYRRFRDRDPADWPAVVADHFRTVAGLTRQDPDDDLNAQSADVLVRLGQPYPDNPALSIWGRPFPETGLAVMLVLAKGGGLRFVRTDMVEASGRSGEEWCAVGLENLRRRTPAGALRVLEPESGLMGCGVGDAHDGSRALLLDDLLPAVAPHGVLASVPSRDVLLVLPLTPGLAQRSLALLKVLTRSQHEEASHPLSPDVFWVRDGVWRPFGIEVREDGVRVAPPEDLAGALRDVLAG